MGGLLVLASHPQGGMKVPEPKIRHPKWDAPPCYERWWRDQNHDHTEQSRDRKGADQSNPRDACFHPTTAIPLRGTQTRRF